MIQRFEVTIDTGDKNPAPDVTAKRLAEVIDAKVSRYWQSYKIDGLPANAVPFKKPDPAPEQPTEAPAAPPADQDGMANIAIIVAEQGAGIHGIAKVAAALGVQGYPKGTKFVQNFLGIGDKDTEEWFNFVDLFRAINTRLDILNVATGGGKDAAFDKKPRHFFGRKRRR